MCLGAVAKKIGGSRRAHACARHKLARYQSLISKAIFIMEMHLWNFYVSSGKYSDKIYGQILVK